MTDREALRSMLIYAQREAEMLKLTSTAQLLALAVADVEKAGAERDAMSTERLRRLEGPQESEFHGYFETRRLQ